MNAPRLVRTSALLSLLLAALGGGRETPAQEIDGAAPVGKLVIVRKGTVLSDSDEIVHDEGRGERLERGSDPQRFHIYRVRKSRDGEVWLAANEVGAQGWASITNVVTLDAAIAYLDEAMRGELDACGVHLARAQVWQALGDRFKPLEEFETAIRLAPRDDRKVSYCLRAAFHAKWQRDSEAVEDCTRAIEIDPRYAPAYTIRGAVRLRSGDIAGSLEDLNRAIEFDPKSARAYHYRGVVRSARGENAQGFEDFLQALKLDPASPGACLLFGDYLLCRGKFDQALLLFDEAIRRDPYLADAYQSRGFARENKKQYPEAADDFSKAIELAPDRSALFCHRAVCWNAAGEYRKAADDSSRAIRLAPGRVDGYITRAIARSSLGDFGKAVDDLDRAVELEPNLEICRFARAMNRLALEDLAGADVDLNSILRGHSGHPSAHRYRGLVALRRGDFDLAIDELNKDALIGKSVAATCRLRGDAWYARKDYEKAIANLEYALGAAPEDHATLNSLAWIVATAPDDHARDGARAVALATQACRLVDEKVPDYLATLAAAFAEAGDFENAAKRQQEAIDRTNDDPATEAKRRDRLALYRRGEPFHVEPGKSGTRDVMSPAERRAELLALVKQAVLADGERIAAETVAARTPRKIQPANSRGGRKADALDRSSEDFGDRLRNFRLDRLDTRPGSFAIE